MPLSEVAVRAAKPTHKPYKLSDEKGLYLLVKRKPSGIPVLAGDSAPA
jgi:hypothetical protein